MPSLFKKLTAFGLLVLWFTLLGVPLAEAMDAFHESPDAADHAIEKVFRLPTLNPDFQMEQGKTAPAISSIFLVAMPIIPSFFEATHDDLRLVLGGPPGSPGVALFKILSNFRI